jgi:hypothetical protein
MALTKVTSGGLTDATITAADLAANSVDSSELVDGSIDTSHIGASQVTDAKIDTMSATKLTGSIADARVPASAVTQHVTTFDDTALRQDITALALHSAVADNKTAHNLPNSFIEQFQDDSGIGTETTVDRNASEYVETTSTAAYGVDSYTKLCINGVGQSNGSTTFTDISSTGHTLTRYGVDWETRAGPYTTDNPSTSIRFDNGGYAATAPDEYLETPASADWQLPDDSAWTIDWWMYYMGPSYYDRIFAHSGDGEYVVTFQTPQSSTTHNFSMRNTGGYSGHSVVTGSGIAQDTWIHWAIEHDTGTLRLWKNGAIEDDESTSDIDWALGSASNTLLIGQHTGGHYTPNCYMTGIRWSKGVARTQQSGDPMYASGGSTFTVPPKPYTAASFDATGTLISNASVASAAQTKVSGVMLYKDNAGTATIGTDLKIYFTCDNGSNWTEAASYGTVSPVFSTGVKMIRLGDTTCTSGTQVKYKAVWANQADGSKETQLHGIGMNY